MIFTHVSGCTSQDRLNAGKSQKPLPGIPNTATVNVGDGFSESLKPKLQQGQPGVARRMPPGQLLVLLAG